MRVFPTTRQEWSKTILLPFKVYSLLGITGFYIWDWLRRALETNAWHLYDDVAGPIGVFYLLAGFVLIVGGLSEIFALKKKGVNLTLFLGIIDVFVSLYFSGTLHA